MRIPNLHSKCTPDEVVLLDWLGVGSTQSFQPTPSQSKCTTSSGVYLECKLGEPIAFPYNNAALWWSQFRDLVSVFDDVNLTSQKNGFRMFLLTLKIYRPAFLNMILFSTKFPKKTEILSTFHRNSSSINLKLQNFWKHTSPIAYHKHVTSRTTHKCNGLSQTSLWKWR